MAVLLTLSTVAALVWAVAATRRARYWRSIVEGPHGTRLVAPDTADQLRGRPHRS